MWRALIPVEDVSAEHCIHIMSVCYILCQQLHNLDILLWPCLPAYETAEIKPSSLSVLGQNWATYITKSLHGNYVSLCLIGIKANKLLQFLGISELLVITKSAMSTCNQKQTCQLPYQPIKEVSLCLVTTPAVNRLSSPYFLSLWLCSRVEI